MSETVNHTLNFVDPVDPSVHTQTIENLWMHMKKFFRENNYTDSEKIESYLGEFCFRKKFKNDDEKKIFSRIMDCYYHMSKHEIGQ